MPAKCKTYLSTPGDDVSFRRQRNRADVEEEVTPEDNAGEDDEPLSDGHSTPVASIAMDCGKISEDGNSDVVSYVSLEAGEESPGQEACSAVMSLDAPEYMDVGGVKVDVTGLDKSMRTRLLTMREYSDMGRGIYYVTKVPDTLRFGFEQAYDMSNFLVRADNVSVAVWVVGRILTARFEEEDGGWHPQPFVSVAPLARQDAKSAARICNLYSKPRQDQELNPFGTIVASRFQKKYNSDKPATEFKSVFDAVEGMKPRRELKAYPVTKLKKSDLVLMEMRVKKRFDAADASMDKKDRPFKISFQLQTLYLLRSGNEIDEDAGVSYDF